MLCPFCAWNKRANDTRELHSISGALESIIFHVTGKSMRNTYDADGMKLCIQFGRIFSRVCLVATTFPSHLLFMHLQTLIDFLIYIRFSGARARAHHLSISKPYTHINDNTITGRHCQSDGGTMQVDMRSGRWQRICRLLSTRVILHTHVCDAILLLAHLSCGRPNNACHQSRI